MKHTGVILLLLVSAWFACVCAAEKTHLQWRESGYGKIHATRAVIRVPAGKDQGLHAVTAPVDLSGFAGKNCVFSIRVRAQDVARPSQDWNGVKFMLSYRDSDGKMQYHHPVKLWGTFDKVLHFRAELPQKFSDARIILGLQDSAGNVTFFLDTLKIQDGDFRRRNAEHTAEYSAAVRNRPVMCGVMLGHNLQEKDFQDLAGYGAALVRAQLTRSWGQVNADRDLAEYDKWLEKRLDQLEKELDWSEKYGMKLVIDLHSPPGGRDADGNLNLLNEKIYLDHFLKTWRKIARRFHGHPALWGYDLVNEPVQTVPGKPDYWEIQRLAAEAIRKIDPETPVIVESNNWCAPETFAYLSPLKLKNIIYQVHMYQPMAFTHQFVHDSDGITPGKLVAWPGEIEGRVWNRTELRKVLQPVRDFQLKHKALIYCGEFSAAVWAPGAEQYLQDCIGIFEEYGWSWTYHAYREWDGWSFEHRYDPVQRKIVPDRNNPRSTVLRKAWRTERK